MVIEGSREYKAAQELCKRIVDSGVLDEAHLPFI